MPIPPVVPGTPMSSAFGWRVLNGERQKHNGTDWAAPLGAPLYAPADSTIIQGADRPDGDVQGYGNWVWGRADDGHDWVLGHMPHGSITVRAGDRVWAGQQVAEVGEEGNADGPHAHLSVYPGVFRQGGEIDPVSWVGDSATQPEEERAPVSFTSFAAKPLRTREQIALEVHKVSLARGLDQLATVIALMTIATEAGYDRKDGTGVQWWCPSNARVPLTGDFPHDSTSDDNRSSGYFQQQPGPNGEPWWGTPEQMMTLSLAADTFLARLDDGYTEAEGNPALAGQYAQRVQRSAYPERYAEHWREAREVLQRALAQSGTPSTAEAPPVRHEAAAVEGPLGTPFGKYLGWSGNPVWLADVLRAAGLRVVEEDGWKDRGRGDFKRLMGVVAHHTADADDEGSLRVVLNGRPDLDGPLAQLVLTKDGAYHVIAAGVAWHAGRGSYRDWPTNNANFYTIGIEAVSRGTPPWDWTPAALAAYDRGVAAILNAVGLPAYDLAAHREYSSEGKPDPAGIDMDQMRQRVQRLIDLNKLPPRDIAVEAAAPIEEAAQVSLQELTWEQLAGPGGHGWAQLGNKSVVDSLAELHQKIDLLTKAVAKLITPSAGA